MAWCHQATSHYLSWCWPRSMLPCGVTRPQWAKFPCSPIPGIVLGCLSLGELHSLDQYEVTLHSVALSCTQLHSAAGHMVFVQGESRSPIVACWDHIDGLMQERCNSIANALELHLSCTNPSTWHHRSQSTLEQVIACCLMVPAISWTNADLRSESSHSIHSTIYLEKDINH